MAQGRWRELPALCRSCGDLATLASETQCQACWDRAMVSVQEQVRARRPVRMPGPVPSAANRPDERWRELWARRKADETAKGAGAEDTWFERHGKPGLCWFCHRRPGNAQYRGACEQCFLGNQRQPPSAESPSIKRRDTTMPTAEAQGENGTLGPAAPDEAMEGHKRGSAARREWATEVIRGLGPGATYAAIQPALREAGCSCSCNAIAQIKRELWPGQGRRTRQPPRPRVQAPAPSAPPVVTSPSPAPTTALPIFAGGGVDVLCDVGDLARRCGGWAQFRKLVDAIDTFFDRSTTALSAATASRAMRAMRARRPD
jgi:hypothetical protein